MSTLLNQRGFVCQIFANLMRLMGLYLGLLRSSGNRGELCLGKLARFSLERARRIPSRRTAGKTPAVPLRGMGSGS